jgi:hypothetical protein
MVDCELNSTDTSEHALFANAEWRVLPDGIEHLQTGYFIDRGAIDRRRDGSLWEWPLHLSEKRWCAPRSLHEVFTVALDRFGIAPDADLARSFAIGFGLRPSMAGAASENGFVAIGEILRPERPASRKRSATPEVRSASRRDQGDRQRVAAGMNG